ncbi:exonuclease domain-containing protein [Micromonospora sp. NPDC006766]|uniref:exonuclease domain-containing protein n=1 Tax=Micromonospora sp. NPDC006766 TaxID=3154778 RepID=UPI0033FFE2FB
MNVFAGPMMAADTESTGVDVENDRIVTATTALIRPGQPPAVAAHLIAVDVDIPQAATDVHGITTEHARANGQPAVKVLDQVAADLAAAMLDGIPVVGCNLAFDLTLLDRELRRHNLPTLPDRLGRDIGPCIDVFVLDKAVDRYRPGRRQLTALCEHYGVRLDGAHDATADALGAARVAWRIGQLGAGDPDVLFSRYAHRPRQAPHIVRGLARVARMSLDELHAFQQAAYREQAPGLAAHFRRKAAEIEHEAAATGEDGIRAAAAEEAEELRRRADDVSGEWPMRPWMEAA